MNPGVDVHAVLFDFNGTLSDDEPLLAEIYATIFRDELGIELARHEYFESLAGLSDPEIVARVLERTGRAQDHDLAAALLDERTRRYVAAVRDRPRIPPGAVALVRAVAGHVPVGVVTGAARAEVEAALDAAGLAGAVRFVVAREDVERGKPDPQGYVIALEQLSPLRASTIMVFEDSIPGLRAATAAGMRPIAVAGTADPAELAREAGGVVDRLDPAELAWLLDALADRTRVRAPRGGTADG